MKNLTKLTALTLTAALALTACGSSAATTAPAAESAAGSTAEAASGDLLSEIQAKGTITVAMEGTWAPWTYHDEDDNLVGYDVEVATEIAKKLGVEPQFVEGEWDGLLAGLDAGRYDIMVNGVDITPERAEKYDFSTPYAFNRTAVITKADDDSINTLEDLKGKKTANTISSTYAELAEQYGATVTGVDDLNQTFELLLSGRIDATLNAEMTFYDYTKEHPDANVKIAVLTDDANQIAIPMRKGDETATLRTAIDAAIDELRAEGIERKVLWPRYFYGRITFVKNIEGAAAHATAPFVLGKLYLAKDAVGQFDAVAFLHPAAAQRFVGVGEHAPRAVSTFQHYVNQNRLVGGRLLAAVQLFLNAENFVFHAASRSFRGGGACLHGLDFFDQHLMALQKVGARALAVGAGAAKLHGGVLLAAVLAHGHGGDGLHGQHRAGQKLRFRRRPFPAVLQIALHHAGDLAQLQRHAPDARHVVLPGHVLHRADDVEYNAKLVHYFSFLAKRILISRFAM